MFYLATPASTPAEPVWELWSLDIPKTHDAVHVSKATLVHTYKGADYRDFAAATSMY